MTAENKDTRTTNPATASNNKKKFNIIPISILVAVLIAGSFAVIFSRNVKSEDVLPKVDANNLEVIKTKVPNIDDSLGWLNTEGISQEKINSSVVIYDFWTYSCINCQRTLPYLRAIYDRYEKDGLIILGVHSPEFDFEKIHSNVEKAAKKYKVNWPVLFDDNMSNWDNFENEFWPAKYITDKKGQLRYEHFGEGRYEETEDVVRALLGVDKDSPRAIFPGAKETTSNEDITPELYLNPVRGKSNINSGITKVETEVKPTLNNITYFGNIDSQLDRTVLQEVGSKMLLNFKAAEVNLVAENINADKSQVAKLKVELDGKPIPKNMRGKDIKVESNGDTCVEVSSPDLVNIINAKKITQGILTFSAQQKNIALYSFTFGS